MGKKIKITKEEYQAVKIAAKKNKHKRIDKKLQVIILRYEGMTCEEIGKKLGYSKQCVSRLCSEFKKYGLEEYIKLKYKGNHRSLSVEEEDAILAEFEEKAKKGQIITVQQIKAAFDKKIGKDTGRGYIYMVLKRKGWRKVMPRGKHPKKASQKEIKKSKKKLKKYVKQIKTEHKGSVVRVMFQDEAGFGRINKPKYCWCRKNIRPSTPCHHIREYRYVYGAAEPMTGESFFLILPYCNTKCTNIFLQELSKEYPDDIIILVCDGASWHKSKDLCIPKNIRLSFLPPYTPEMNPIEQIWKEVRKMGFCNEVFGSLKKVVDRLCDTICNLSKDIIKSITGRDWILEIL